MIPTDRFAEEMKEIMDALIVTKVTMQAQEVPEPRYVIFPDETYEQLERIIYTDKVNIEDCKMTERTVDQVCRDIQAVEKRIEDRAFIVGPSYMRAIVSFRLKADADDLEGDNFEVWDKQMDDYINGNSPGKLLTVIETTGCEGEVCLDDKLLKKISNVKFDIKMNEVSELMELKQERAKIRNIDEKRHALEMAEKGLAVNKRPCPRPTLDIMSL